MTLFVNDLFFFDWNTTAREAPAVQKFYCKRENSQNILGHKRKEKQQQLYTGAYLTSQGKGIQEILSFYGFEGNIHLGKLPEVQGGIGGIKDYSIPLFPNAPGSYDEAFHEKGPPKSLCAL